MTAMLRTVILVLIPAVLVHGVLTLGNDFIPLFEWCFTEVTGLRHHLTAEAHLVTTIDIDILLLKELEADIGLQQLEHEP